MQKGVRTKRHNSKFRQKNFNRRLEKYLWLVPNIFLKIFQDDLHELAICLFSLTLHWKNQKGNKDLKIIMTITINFQQNPQE